jgi:hypothetical protein
MSGTIAHSFKGCQVFKEEEVDTGPALGSRSLTLGLGRETVVIVNTRSLTAEKRRRRVVRTVTGGSSSYSSTRYR